MNDVSEHGAQDRELPLLGGAPRASRGAKRCCCGKSSRQAWGWTSLVLLVLSWVGQAELAQLIETSTSSTAANFNKPAFITILNQGCMFVCLPLAWIYLKATGRKSRDLGNENDAEFSFVKYLAKQGYTRCGFTWNCVWLAFIYFFSTYLWYLALGSTIDNTRHASPSPLSYTPSSLSISSRPRFATSTKVPAVSVGLATAIYNTSVVFVWGFSLCLLGDSLSVGKMIGMLLALGGACLCGISQSPLGDVSFNLWSFVVLGSAATYGLFEVMYKWTTLRAATRRPPEFQKFSESVDVPLAMGQLFTGGIGLAHIFVVSVLLIPLHFSGVERFEWPTAAQWKLLAVNAVAGTLFNASFVMSLTLMEPLFVAMATLLTIPASFVADIFIDSLRNELSQKEFGTARLSGMAAIVCGFLVFECFDTCRRKCKTSASAHHRIT